jgi:prepilin-type N-terminal cleavage/methylation domain-containing protein
MAEYEKKVRFNDCGFTLAEVLVAMGVFAILAAIAVPNFTAQLPTYRLNGAARQVFADLMWARTKAVEENTTVIVTLPNPAGTTYTIVGGTVNTAKNIQANYSGITLNRNTGPNPTFSSRGTTGGETTVTVSNGGETRTVRVRPTGVTSID